MGSLLNLSCSRCGSVTCCGDACARTIEEIQVELIYPETTLSYTVTVNGTLKQKKCWIPIKLGCCHNPISRTGVSSDTVRDILVEFDLPDADVTNPGDKLVVTTCTPKSVLAMGTFVHGGTYYDTQSWYWADERYIPSTLEISYKGVLHNIPLTPTGSPWTQAGVASRIQTALRALDSPPGTYPELATINVTVTMDAVEPSCTVLNDRTVSIEHGHPDYATDTFTDRAVLRGLMLVLEENLAPFTFADGGIKLSGNLYVMREKSTAVDPYYDTYNGAISQISSCCEEDVELLFRKAEQTYYPLSMYDDDILTAWQPCDENDPLVYPSANRIPFVGQYCDSTPPDRVILPEIRVKLIWADEGPCDITAPAPFPIRVDEDFPDVKEQPLIDKVLFTIGSTVITLDNNAIETPVTTEVVNDDWPPSSLTKKLRGNNCNLFGSTCYLDNHTRELKWAVSPNTNGIVVDGMFTLKFSDVNEHGVGLCVNNYFTYFNAYRLLMETASIVRGSPTMIVNAAYVKNCELVSGSRTITSSSGNFAGLFVGMPVTGTGIPTGTVVTRWNTLTTVILSKAVTSTASTVSISFGDAAVLAVGMQVCQGGLFPIGAEITSVVGRTITLSHAATRTYASGFTNFIRFQKLNSTLLSENSPQGWVASDFNDGDDVGIRAWAVDRDISNNTVSYSLTDDAGGRFAIDSSTGIVTLVDHTLIDFATDAYHNITVEATSSDTSTSTTTFRIDVSDEHISDSNTTVNKITENSSTGTAVGITALLSGSGIVYSFEELENAEGRFTINSSTGVITTATAINREIDEASYSVLVKATRTDTTYELRWFKIMVGEVDEDDVTTSAVSLGSATIVEGCGIGTVVHRLQDKFKFTPVNVDTDVHAVLTYSMTTGHSRFAITSEGTITTIASIIRSEGTSWTLSILVTSDDGSSANLSFLVTVLESLSNSNAEYVPPTTFTNISTGGDVITVAESTSPGAIGLQVQAINSNHPYLKFTYSLYNPTFAGTDETINGNSLVSIDATTGIVTLLNSVDGDHVPYVNLFIRATAEQNSSCETRILGEASYYTDNGIFLNVGTSPYGLMIGQSYKDWSQVADNTTSYNDGVVLTTIEVEGAFLHREYVTLYMKELLLQIRIINGDYQIKWTCEYLVLRALTGSVEATVNTVSDPVGPGATTSVTYEWRKGEWQESTYAGLEAISRLQSTGGSYASDWTTINELADLFTEITLPTGDWLSHSTGPTASLPLGGYTDPTDATRISVPIGFMENLPDFPGVYITPSLMRYFDYDVSTSTVTLKIQLVEAP